MPIYGYSKGILNEYGLHGLSEVTFDVPAADLRRVAAFLNATADAIESRALRSNHGHLTRNHQYVSPPRLAGNFIQTVPLPS
jgi:hypothetical protein